MILNRICHNIDDQLIPKQAGSCPGRTSTDQIINLIHHIQDGYANHLGNGGVLVDLSSPYDREKYKLSLKKLYGTTEDLKLAKSYQISWVTVVSWSNLGVNAAAGEHSKMGLLTLFNIYTNE